MKANKKCFLICTLLSLCLGASRATPAQDQGAGMGFLIFPVRQQERKQSRWTLAEWMETKKKMAAQDAWLAAHTNKFPIDVTYGFDVGQRLRGHEFSVGLFRLGFLARHEDVQTWLDSDAQSTGVNLRSSEIGLQYRLFGGNPQDTLLTLQGLFRHDEILNPTAPTGSLNGWKVGPELQIYFANWLGVRANWHKGFKQTPDKSFFPELRSTNWSAVAFLEMGALRLEYGIRQREFQFNDSGTSSSTKDQEKFSRLRVFF